MSSSTELSSSIFSKEGPFGLLLRNYEEREEQRQMFEDILSAYQQNSVALIEAGTGTGKSISYLIPAFLWAAEHKQRTLIATHTITLQEQLLHKDIPLVKKALDLDLKVCLVKGMGNYVCKRKLDDSLYEKSLLTQEEQNEIAQIEEWTASTLDGTRSTLPFVPTRATWERVAAEGDTCTARKCPHYDNCFFMKARNEAEDAQILISNHHLLFADLANDKSILPEYQRIVIDEAHHVEDVATEYLASQSSRMHLLRIVGRLAAENGNNEQGKLPQLKARLQDFFKSGDPPEAIRQVMQTIAIELPAARKELLDALIDTFHAFEMFVEHIGATPSDSKQRIRKEHLSHPLWSQEIVPHVHQLLETIERYVRFIESCEELLASGKNEALDSVTNGLRKEIAAMATRLGDHSLTLSKFIATEIKENEVRWIENRRSSRQTNTYVTSATLDVSEALAALLFEPHQTVILCSATLATNQGFSYIRKRLGISDALLPNRTIQESIYASPFDYRSQALFAIPKDLPEPDAPAFLEKACSTIWESVRACKGNAFVLFTSYSMMRECHSRLSQKMAQGKFPLLLQGQTNRKELLETFKKTYRAVLFGTDSFWEGVDVVGDALRCVIIVKLPFKVPSEPLIEARAEFIAKQGGNPFREYSLPQAIVKFKQGFGRLIRNKNDHGSIICLDQRILTRPYGKQFQKNLPACSQWNGPSDQMYHVLVKFYAQKSYSPPFPIAPSDLDQSSPSLHPNKDKTK